MAGPNGTARVLRAPLRLSPQTITYQIIDDDGETVALAGYKRGPGCPITISIAVEEAFAEWNEEKPTDGETGTPADPERGIEAVPGTINSHRWLAKANRAERMLHRNLLCAVIPGLEESAANILAGDEGPWRDILVELGWWAAATEEGGDADPEAGAGAPISGSPASPDSSPATASTPAEPA